MRMQLAAPLVAAALCRFAVALWFGGMAVLTFVMTPVIFRTQPRETAARVVGAMMPVYFRYLAVVVGVALAARFAAGGALSGPQPSLGTVILGIALAPRTCGRRFTSSRGWSA